MATTKKNLDPAWERRTARMQILLSEPEWQDLTRISFMRRCSIASLLTPYIPKVIKQYASDIQKYKEIFGDEPPVKKNTNPDGIGGTPGK